MAPDVREQYIAALEMVRDRLWPDLAGDFHRLQTRDRGFPDYADADWNALHRSIFDAIALAVLEVRGVPVGDEPRSGPSPFAHLPRPVPLDDASDLAYERYWRGANAYFHVVWSRDVGRDGYVKAAWQGFEDRIVDIIAAAIVATRGGNTPLA